MTDELLGIPGEGRIVASLLRETDLMRAFQGKLLKALVELSEPDVRLVFKAVAACEGLEDASSITTAVEDTLAGQMVERHPLIVSLVESVHRSREELLDRLTFVAEEAPGPSGRMTPMPPLVRPGGRSRSAGRRLDFEEEQADIEGRHRHAGRSRESSRERPGSGKDTRKPEDAPPARKSAKVQQNFLDRGMSRSLACLS